MRNKIKPTIEEAFATGKLVGSKEALEEIKLLLDTESMLTLSAYIRARLKTLHTASIHNPFNTEKP